MDRENKRPARKVSPAAREPQAGARGAPGPAQRALDASPRMVGQRRRITAAFGPSVVTGGPVVQRAVGFEFQCRHWEMGKEVEVEEDQFEDDIGFDFGQPVGAGPDQADASEWRELPDKGKVMEGEGWLLSPDGGEPEFIVSHEAENLGETMDDMMEVVGHFQAAIVSHRGGAFDLSDLGEVDDDEAQIRPKGRPVMNVTADAQVNAGIRFSRVFDLMKDLGNERSDAGEQLSGNRRVGHYAGDTELISKARARAAKLLESGAVRDRLTGDAKAKEEKARSLMGFLALVGMYLAKAADLSRNKRLVKDFPVMIRTGMDIVAQHSVPPELLDEEGLPILVEAAVKAGDRDDANEEVYGNDVDGDSTIDEWIRGLAAGEDKLHEVDMNLGALDDDETVGKDEAPALVAELRRVKEEMPWGEWTGFALGVEKWLEKVNQPKGKYTPYKHDSL